MNIKMNMVLSNLNFIKNIYIAPTELMRSLSIGACYFLNKENNKPIKNIYLGQKITENKLSKKNDYQLFKKQ